MNVASATPASSAPTSAGGYELLSRVGRSLRVKELSDAGFLVAQVVQSPRVDSQTGPGFGRRPSDHGGPLQRDELRAAIDSAVELSLALRGALPPSVEIDADPVVTARDQLFRVRTLGAPGLCLMLPALAGLADARGRLSAGDSATLEAWQELCACEPINLLLDEQDRAVKMLAPKSIGDVFSSPSSCDEESRDDPTSGIKERAAEALDAIDQYFDDSSCRHSVSQAGDPSHQDWHERDSWGDLGGAVADSLFAEGEPSDAADSIGGRVFKPGRIIDNDPLGDLIDELDDPPIACGEALEDPPVGDFLQRDSLFDQELPPEVKPLLAAPLPPMSDEMCRAYVSELDAARGPRPVSVIEDLFRDRYVPLIEALHRGMESPEAREVTGRWRAAFEKSYGDGFTALRVTGKRPPMVLDAPDIAARIGRLNGARAVQLLLVDGLRYDLGQRVLDKLTHCLTGRAVCVEETLLWSALPTITPVQMRLLSRGARGLREQEPESERESTIHRGKSVNALRRVRIGQRDLVKLDVVEARLRDAGPSYDLRFDAISEEVAQTISGYCDSLPAKTLLYVFGDHGFQLPIPGRDATGPAEQGGASPEEVLVGGQAWLVGATH